MGELSFPKFRILQVYRKHLLIYLALASNSDDISSMCNLFCLTAEGWPDDDANCRSWNYSCRSYLGHFPSFSGMTNLVTYIIFQIWCIPKLDGGLLFVALISFIICVCLIYTIIAESFQNEEGSSRNWWSVREGKNNLRFREKIGVCTFIQVTLLYGCA